VPSLPQQIYALIRRQRLTETQVMVCMAFVVGLGSGFGAVLFRELIAFFTWVFFSELGPFLSHGSRLYLIVLPALGALLFAPLILYFAPEAKGHGVPEVMLAVALKGGRMRPAIVVVKALASAINIGSGGSVGREGPIVQVGSAIGSSIGQLFKMSDSRIKNLVAAGAAGGISATFNAPFAGAFFALEVILGEFNIRNFSTVVISAVTADVIGRAFFGFNASFAVPLYAWRTPLELPLYLLLGILAALVGVLFMQVLYATEDVFDRWSVPVLIKPVIGGLLLGALAVVVPRGSNSVPSAILSVGYPTINAALYGRLALGFLLLFMVTKIIAVALTIGSGGSGGVFAPSLYVGAMLGGAFGLIAHTLLPGIVGSDVNGYAIAGMAAVFAGAAQAPITSIMILFEMTSDYKIIIPLMVAVVTATLVGRALSTETIYTLKLFRRGINLSAGREVNVMRRVHVRDAMETPVQTVPPTMPIADLVSLMNETHRLGFPVVDERNCFLGMVRAEDIEERLLGNGKVYTVSEIVEHSGCVHPDENLEQALDRFGVRDQRRIPVVSRANPHELVGILHAWDVLNAYRAEVIRQQE
jgi:CIC family chloride channel protein